MSTINAANITDGTTSVPTGYVVNGSAKAWINFSGENTVAINDSYNFSSISDDGTGQYTVNFSTNMGNTHYAPTAQTEDGNGYNDPRVINHESSQARSTSAYGLYHWHVGTSSLDDPVKMNVIVHGDLA
jgi:hypothetical protein